MLWIALSGAIGHGKAGVANFAHLAGAGWGVLYKFFDLRWSTLSQRFSGGRQRRKKETRSQGSGSLWNSRQQKDEKPRVPDNVSRRVDELLEKIHQEGMGSLSDEEREFLVENSRATERAEARGKLSRKQSGSESPPAPLRPRRPWTFQAQETCPCP